MSPRALLAIGSLSGFPRVSGDEPARVVTSDQLLVFSPRERG